MEKVALILGEVGYEQLNYDADIPSPKLKDSEFNTFMGFVLRELLNLTNSKTSTFILTGYGFYNSENGKEILTLKMLNILHQCIGVSGLQGLDYLLSIKIMKSMEKLLKLYEKISADEKSKKILIKSLTELKSVGGFSDRYDSTLTGLKKYFKL